LIKKKLKNMNMKQNKIKCKEKFYHILWIKMKKKELKEEL